MLYTYAKESHYNFLSKVISLYIMFILLLFISECSSVKVDLCNAVSLLGVPCDQNCVNSSAPNNSMLLFKNSCMNDFYNFEACLINIAETFEYLLPSISNCFSKVDLIKIKEIALIIKSKFHCVSILLTISLTENEGFLANFEYMIKKSYRENCEKNKYINSIVKQLATDTNFDMKSDYIQDFFKLVLTEYGEKVEYKHYKDKFKDYEDIDKSIEETDCKSHNHENNKNCIKDVKDDIRTFDTNKFTENENKKLNRSQIDAILLSYKKGEGKNANKSYFFSSLISILIYILEFAEQYIYCAVNSLVQMISLKKLEQILPEKLFSIIEYYFKESETISGSGSYYCSSFINKAFYLVVDALKKNEKKQELN